MGSMGSMALNVGQCHKPAIFLGMVDIPTIYGDDWGWFTIVIPTLYAFRGSTVCCGDKEG